MRNAELHDYCGRLPQFSSHFHQLSLALPGGKDGRKGQAEKAERNGAGTRRTACAAELRLDHSRRVINTEKKGRFVRFSALRAALARAKGCVALSRQALRRVPS
jgi:hypothetical protein